MPGQSTFLQTYSMPEEAAEKDGDEEAEEVEGEHRDRIHILFHCFVIKVSIKK